MAAKGLLELPRAVAQLSLRLAHVERQAREDGECAICGAALRLHYAGDGCRGTFLGCELARDRETFAQQTVAMSVHAHHSAAALGAGKEDAWSR